ncbi:MAG: GNAT family N-acetyltransferase [Eubacterium sp.]|nr:GNAT family N-acetyltransferase [Eubacterium sp.]
MQIDIASPGDAPALLNIYAPYILNTAVTFEYDVPTEADFRRRIETTLDKYPYLVAKEGGGILGYAYATTFIGRSACDWSVETSIYVAEDSRRGGIGKRLYLALEEILKRQSIVNLCAAIASPRAADDPYLNRNSILFHESLGYRLAGRFEAIGYKFDRWYDLVWMEKCIGDKTGRMPDFIAFPDIRDQIEDILETFKKV